jgi:hypothetical protein
MSITGGIKFFKASKNLLADGASITSTSASSSADYAIDRNTDTYWRSVSSNDTVTETLEVTFDSSKTIDRILLLDHNWKQFTIQYDVSGVWTNFASVVGLDGNVGSSISTTTFADDTAYFEFTPVTTGKIRIQVVKTQIANQDKYISQIICTEELGTLQGFPVVLGPTLDRNEKKRKALSGRVIVQKSTESAAITLNFKNYPSQSTYNADMDLMFELFDLEDPFIVWLCGGRRGTNYFKYTLRGFRLQDAYTVQITREFETEYTNNIYSGPVNVLVQLEEHI